MSVTKSIISFAKSLIVSKALSFVKSLKSFKLLSFNIEIAKDLSLLFFSSQKVHFR
jgi:hypothetical protein